MKKTDLDCSKFHHILSTALQVQLPLSERTGNSIVEMPPQGNILASQWRDFNDIMRAQ
jgi:hypothetical protein